MYFFIHNILKKSVDNVDKSINSMWEVDKIHDLLEGYPQNCG